MGLTIHYRYRFDGSRSEMRKHLQTLKKAVEELPEDVDVPGLFHYTAGTLKSNIGIGLGPDSDSRAAVEEYYRGDVTGSLSSVHGTRYETPDGREVADPAGYSGRLRIIDQPGQDEVMERWEAFVIPVWVTSGCEPFEIVLGRKTGTREWYGRGFTKTQYADDFVRAHLTVVAMLDIADRLELVDEVSDEGDYWETRDLQKLTNNINEYRALVDGIGDVLEALAEDTDITVEGGKDQTNVVL